MSDYPQGPGWWQASDGRWYAPQEPTAPPPQTPSPYPPYPGPPPQPKSKGPLIAIVVAVAVVAAAIVGFIVVAGRDDDVAVDDPVDDSTTTTRADDEGESGGGGGLDIDVADGFTAVVDEEEGFALALPEEWQEFNLRDRDVQASLDEFGDNNPEMGSALEQTSSIIAAGGVLFALDPNRVPFAPNINIIKSPGEINLDFLESTVEAQLEAVGAENISTEIVELPAGEALAIEYDLALNLPDGNTIDVHGLQFQVPAGESTWAITMTTDDIGREGDVFDEIIESFTVAD